jgi:hypothetical protein
VNRVFRYGLLSPDAEKIDAIESQATLLHRYRNMLIQIERARRAALRELEGGGGGIPALQAAADEAKRFEDDAEKAVKAARKKTRSRSETEDARAVLRVLRIRRSKAVGELKQAMALIRQDPEIAAARKAINERSEILRKGARGESGCYWGSYLLQENAMEASQKMPLYDKTMPNDPRFKSASKRAQFGVLIQNGITVKELFAGASSKIRIDAPCEEAAHSGKRRDRRHHAGKIHLRIASDDNAKPVWVSWPIIMHRPIPEGSLIKSAVVTRSTIGPRTQWSLALSVDVPDELARGCGEGAVAIDIGWRIIGNDLRVATWRDQEGHTGDLRLSEKVIKQLRKPEELRSTRDQNFDAARDKLGAWIKAQLELGAIPAWLLDRAKSIAQWRSQDRLAAVALFWKTNRFDGDTDAYEALEGWRYHDWHLWKWETSQRIKALRHRREIYRIFAADLSRRYSTLIVEDFDLSKMSKKQPTEGVGENQNARSNRFLAATSELRIVLSDAFHARGGEMIKVGAMATTIECHVCHHVETFDKASSVDRADPCPKCGAQWDQDVNAAINLLARWDAIKDKPRAEKKPRESRWAKKKRTKAEKYAAELQKQAGAHPSAPDEHSEQPSP